MTTTPSNFVFMIFIIMQQIKSSLIVSSLCFFAMNFSENGIADISLLIMEFLVKYAL